MPLPDIRLSDFNYDLPEARIAFHPVEPRHASKLLLYKKGKISHNGFSDLPGMLPKESALVFNNTKVIPARIVLQKQTGTAIEVLLLHPDNKESFETALRKKDTSTWICMIGNLKKWKEVEVLSLKLPVDGKEITVNFSLANREEKKVKLSWEGGFTLSEVIDAAGKIPLPPYIKRDAEEKDRQDYQTIYARYQGAVAAPTAGLHFTDEIMQSLDEKKIEREFVTLHVGAGTFLPVKHNNPTDHPMHNESVSFGKDLIEFLIKNRENIIPVGTTSLRALESLYHFGALLKYNPDSGFFIPKLAPYQEQDFPETKESLELVLEYMDKNKLQTLFGNTEILIMPGYKFRLCKGLITNFHQPGSTLTMLVAALVGDDWKKIYSEALNNDYRFLSYGDSSLLLP